MKQIKVEATFFVFLLLLIVFFLIIGPFIQIWAVNTLFKTSVEYSWINWAAVLILNSSISAFSYRGK
jgi:hypothetical protein